jgi:NAD(P)-dependent dehydrogenase (short-subunit alcohol dehydrogenase family)
MAFTGTGPEGAAAERGRALPRAAVVLGARNVGGAIARELVADGAGVAAVARTEADLDQLAGVGVASIPGDASDESDLRAALRRAAAELGPLDLIVNATAPDRPAGDRSFGGGSIAEATLEGFDGWAVPGARLAFLFLREGARLLKGQGGGTLIQVVGAPARRADAERGLVAAAQAAIRAMAHAAAQELKPEGIHVGLLIVDGVVSSPKTAAMTRGMPESALVKLEDVATAVRLLAGQPPGGWTHELVITPAGGRWVP